MLPTADVHPDGRLIEGVAVNAPGASAIADREPVR